MSAESKIGVTVATPIRSFTGPESLPKGLRVLLHQLSKLKDCPYAFNFAGIAGSVSRGRNKLVADFLASQDVWLLFSDDDVEPTADDVLRMLSHALPIVGGLYCFRQPGGGYVLNGFIESAPDEETGLMRVAELGTGFKLYHRRVFTEAIRLFPHLAYNDPDGGGMHYGFFQQREESGRWYSEDYWFDKICRTMKVPIVADTRVKVVHRGPYGTAYPINGEWPALPSTKKRVPLPNAGKLIVLLSVSRGDVVLALKWLERAKETNVQDIVIVCSSAVDPLYKAKLRKTGLELVISEETTNGAYPRAANHQFLEGLKYCEKAHPQRPVFYVEPDTFIMRASWYGEISKEYAACGKPFMGHAVNEHYRPHIAGCCVYPANWRTVAPSIAALDEMPWNEAWDTACAHEIYPQAARANTIFQLWKPAPFTEETLKLIPESCALFHQSKGAELYDLIPLRPQKRMKVYTYYAEVDGLQDPELLELWKASWIRHGWEPIVLTEADAIKANPEMFERFKTSPLMKSHPGNPEAYTFACLARWVAMTAIEEPCMHVDWDVLNRGWKPADVENLPTTKPTFMAVNCPCAIYSGQHGWDMLVDVLECTPNSVEFRPAELRKDASDQYAFMLMPKNMYHQHPDRPCRDYGRGEGWNESPLAHFPNASTPYPRSTTVKRMGFEL